MLGRDVAGYARRYCEYFDRHGAQAKEKKTMLDVAPRMVLDPALGFVAAGRTARDAAIVEELYEHTIDVILRAEALGGWRALESRHTFDIEYWDLEQAKLRKAGSPPPFAGEVVLVTGAASGIGKACVESFLKRGAAVLALDRNPAIESLWKRPEVLGITCDLTDAKAIDAALEWAKDGIRINTLHPNQVFDTALWTDEVLAARAKAYNMSVEQYKKNNLLRTEVSSKDVAELAAEMCGPLFAKTTAAQVPVDGGNERVV